MFWKAWAISKSLNFWASSLGLLCAALRLLELCALSSPSESLELWEAWNLNFILELQGLSFVCVELCLGKLGASRILVLELQGFLSYLDMRLCSPWEIMTLWDSSLELGDRAWGRQTCTLSRRLVARAPRASPPCVARPAVLLCCWQYYLIHRYGTYLPCEM